MISIATAFVSSPNWAELLIKSIRKFTTVPYEIIVIDNGSVTETLEWISQQKDVNILSFSKNMGHGLSMEFATKIARFQYVCFLDVDSHIQRKNWDTDLLELYNRDKKTRMIGIEGSTWRPFAPPLFFYEREFILEKDIVFNHIPGISTDTAQKSYWDILRLGYNVRRLLRRPTSYEQCRGDEVFLNSESTFYHHWNGTRFNEHDPKIRKDKLEGITIGQHLESKRKVFQHPRVLEILGGESETRL